MNDPVFYQGGGFRVTATLLTTPRRTYAMKNIEYVSVTRPLLIFIGGPALAMSGGVLAFWRYLYVNEIAAVLAASGIALASAFLFGTLRVHSLALRDDEVSRSFGPFARLRDVRRAVEKAMLLRAGGGLER